jgi:hypothetical protein
MSQAPAHQFEWWDHIFILHALKLGLAGVLALFFAETLRLQFPQWSLFTVMVLMIVQYPGSIALNPSFAVSNQKGESEIFLALNTRDLRREKFG